MKGYFVYLIVLFTALLGIAVLFDFLGDRRSEIVQDYIIDSNFCREDIDQVFRRDDCQMFFKVFGLFFVLFGFLGSVAFLPDDETEEGNMSS